MLSEGLPGMIRLRLYQFLDYLGSRRRLFSKWMKHRKWGKNWRDYSRSGRVLRRVGYDGPYESMRLRRPGWEWNCPNCKTYSFVTAEDLPQILETWRKLVEQTRAGARKRRERENALIDSPQLRATLETPEESAARVKVP